MDRNLLSVFFAVAEGPSFAAAADKLEVQRSAVSRSVAALERDLGVQLFNRTTRHLALTTAGAALYAKVKPLQAALDEALGSLPEQAEAPAGELRITTTGDVAALLLPRVLAGFTQRFPGISVDVRVSNRVVDLVGEGFDLALRVAGGRLPSSGLIAKKLAPIDVHCFAAPSYLARAGTPRTAKAAAEEHAWVSFRGLKTARPFLPPLRTVQVVGDDMLFVLEAVRAGMGLALIPYFLGKPDLAEGRLVRVLPKLSTTFGALHLVHPPAQHVPRKVTVFRDHLIEHLALHTPFG